MKLQAALLGFLLCLAAQAASKPGQTAPVADKAAPAAQTLAGCVDEQDGHYVLLNDGMVKIANLQLVNSDQETFAKHLGRKVQVKGTWVPRGGNSLFKVTAIEHVAGNCGESK